MNPEISDIPSRILQLAVGALAQANMHAAFAAPRSDHWDFISIVNTAHAGELFFKAAIASEHPLLVFKDLFAIDDSSADFVDVDSLIRRGKTHDFEKLPQVLWVTTGVRIQNMNCFDRLRRCRNAIQHFCAPDNEDFRRLSLEFIYTIIDPMIRAVFGLYAIDYHEDHEIGYDYLVHRLLKVHLRFSVPDDFDIVEISMREALTGAPDDYRNWMVGELERIGRLDLLNKR